MDRVSAPANGMEGRARWSLRLFGGFELNELPGGEKVAISGKRERVALAFLVLSPNYRTSRRKLATLLWGGASDEAALDNLRVCLWGLRVHPRDWARESSLVAEQFPPGQPGTPTVAPRPATRGTLAWIFSVGVAAATALFLTYQFAGPIAQPTGVEAAKKASSSPAGTITIAVLPFTNLSSDKEQEFFSDGITEDIITALAKIPDLRVVARVSAFQYKGEKTDMRAVGQALNATHLIEGSVRKVGGRVRVTAQLVKADDGVAVWADS